MNLKQVSYRLAKFVFTSGAGTVVDTVVLWLLSHFVFESYSGDYLLAPFISFECAVFTNFCCFFFFVWKDRIADRHNVRLFFRKYGLYNASATMVFLLKMGILLLIELFTGWNVVICNLAALCLSGLVNFSMGEWVIFRKNRQ